MGSIRRVWRETVLEAQVSLVPLTPYEGLVSDEESGTGEQCAPETDDPLEVELLRDMDEVRPAEMLEGISLVRSAPVDARRTPDPIELERGALLARDAQWRRETMEAILSDERGGKYEARAYEALTWLESLIGQAVLRGRLDDAEMGAFFAVIEEGKALAQADPGRSRLVAAMRRGPLRQAVSRARTTLEKTLVRQLGPEAAVWDARLNVQKVVAPAMRKEGLFFHAHELCAPDVSMSFGIDEQNVSMDAVIGSTDEDEVPDRREEDGEGAT